MKEIGVDSLNQAESESDTDEARTPEPTRVNIGHSLWSYPFEAREKKLDDILKQDNADILAKLNQFIIEEKQLQRYLGIPHKSQLHKQASNIFIQLLIREEREPETPGRKTPPLFII